MQVYEFVWCVAQWHLLRRGQLTYGRLVEAYEEFTPALVVSILSGTCFVFQPAFAPVGVQYDAITVISGLALVLALLMFAAGVVDTRFQGLGVTLHIMVLNPFSFHRCKMKVQVQRKGRGTE